MLYAIQNSKLLLAVDSLGAQMMHLQTADGQEYLWQGDAAYWPDRAPVLFPFIGRLTHNRYRYEGQEYPMGIHGFAAQQEFTCRTLDPDRLVLELTDNSETHTQYPFSFSLALPISW